MATQRTAGLGAMTGPSSPNFAAGARLGDNGVRGAGFGNGPVRRGERLPAPLLRRVQLDGWRPRRIQSHVLVSLVQLADLLVMLIAGAASFAMQSRIVWPLPALPALMAALVLALMTRTSKPSLSSSSELMRQRFFEQFIDGAVYALAAFGFALGRQSRGTTAELVELSRRFEIDRVIVALPHSAEKRLLEILRKLHKMPVEISLAPDMVGFNVPAKDPEAFGGVPLLDVYGRPLTYGQGFVKTIFDRLAAGVGMILLSPMLLAVALAIKLDSRGPVVFRQNRYGFGDRVIEVYKFRTMRAEAADPDGERQTEANDPRLTRIGGFLRRWSLDELPQLFNVLRGELSLVGPRPHAVSMHVRQRRNEDIVPDYALRHHVKPGITGWAQVNGYHGPVATERALRQRVAYDLDYIDRWSLWFDIRIILKTLLIAFGQRHAS